MPIDKSGWVIGKLLAEQAGRRGGADAVSDAGR